jgi:hypothetical protein
LKLKTKKERGESPRFCNEKNFVSEIVSQNVAPPLVGVGCVHTCGEMREIGASRSSVDKTQKLKKMKLRNYVLPSITKRFEKKVKSIKLRESSK